MWRLKTAYNGKYTHYLLYAQRNPNSSLSRPTFASGVIESRMKDDKEIKTLRLGIMDGSDKKRRPHGEWCDDIMVISVENGCKSQERVILLRSERSMYCIISWCIHGLLATQQRSSEELSRRFYRIRNALSKCV